MIRATNKDRVDALIDHFWQKGYLTISRKFGTYLPAPKPIGNYEVDAIAKYKEKVVLGITLTENDLEDPKIISRLNFLATRHTRYSNKRVTLFIGVPNKFLTKAKQIISDLDEEARSHIRLVGLKNSLNYS
ncbi:hypothetical protein ACFLTH_05335 [Bacteroidota bacterium]